MDAKSGRSINEYTKEELLSAPKRKWDTVLENIAGVYLIPNGEQHDSGYNCIDFVAESNEGLFRCGDGTDAIHLLGEYFSVDCLYPSGIIHIWSRAKFIITEDLSSVDLIEYGSKEYFIHQEIRNRALK